MSTAQKQILTPPGGECQPYLYLAPMAVTRTAVRPLVPREPPPPRRPRRRPRSWRWVVSAPGSVAAVAMIYSWKEVCFSCLLCRVRPLSLSLSLSLPRDKKIAISARPGMGLGTTFLASTRADGQLQRRYAPHRVREMCKDLGRWGKEASSSALSNQRKL